MTAKEWTEDEIAMLREMRARRIPVPVIAKALGRPVPATYNRARIVGATVMERRDWSAEEVERLRNLHASDLSIRAIAGQLGRNEPSVRWKLEELGLNGTRTQRWTPDEDARLRMLISRSPDVSLTVLVREVNAVNGSSRSPEAVDARILTLGLRKRRRHTWTREAVAILEANKDNVSVAAELLGFPLSVVEGKARRMGLLKRSGASDGEIDAMIASAISRKADLDGVAASTGRSVRSLRRRAMEMGLLEKRAAPSMTESDREAIIAAARSGEGVTAVARRLRRDVRTVKAVAEEAGVSFVRAVRPRQPKPVVARRLMRSHAVSVPRVTERKPATIYFERRRETAPARLDMDEAVARFIAEKGVTRERVDPVEETVRGLRRKGYSVVVGAAGWVVDGRTRIADDGELIAFARARGVGVPASVMAI